MRQRDVVLSHQAVRNASGLQVPGIGKHCLRESQFGLCEPLRRKAVKRGRLIVGMVEAVGNGRFIEATGKREPLDVKVGDRVVYAKYAGSEIKLDETEYLILSEKDILAVVANGKA